MKIIFSYLIFFMTIGNKLYSLYYILLTMGFGQTSFTDLVNIYLFTLQISFLSAGGS